MSFLELRIRGRLYSGFGLLILLSAALAGFSIWQLWSIRSQVGTMAIQSKNTIRAGEIATELQAIRRNLLRYAFDQDGPSFADSNQRLTTVTSVLEDATKTATSEERRAAYLSASGELAELRAKRAEFGDAVGQTAAGRNLLFSAGDKLTADIQELVGTADKTPFAAGIKVIESNVLLIRVAAWRMLATRDAKGIDIFKTNLGKARRQIAELEKADLPISLSTLLTPVKIGLGRYAEAFEMAAPNLVRADELYYKGITPLITSATQKMGDVQASIGRTYQKTTADTDDRINDTITMEETVTAAVVLLGLLIAFMIAGGITRPLFKLTFSMTELAGGNLAAAVPGTDRHDEVGDMARTVEVFKKNGLEVERIRAEQQMTEKRNAEQRKIDMVRLADDFEGAVGEIIEAVSSASTDLEASAGTLTSTAERGQNLSTVVATASEEASANVQSVASATEELSSSINEISRQVQESARMAGEAVGQARKTNDRVGELSKAAARIGDVVELINTIAGQTNLLALNATIEAARAGDAGRGFAVVASEVKALAEQTAKATGEIGQQIAGIQAATQVSVGAIKEISGTIERLSEISSTIAAAVEEQGAATQEISRNVQQAAQGTQQVSSNIIDVQRSAGQTGSASAQVLSAAQSLSSDGKRLKFEVGKFLDNVRAA